MPKFDGPSTSSAPYGPPRKRKQRTRTLATSDEVAARKAMRELSIDPAAAASSDTTGLAAAMRVMRLKFAATEEGEIDPGEGVEGAGVSAPHDTANEMSDPAAVVYSPQPSFTPEVPACYWGPESIEPWSWLDEDEEDLTLEECIARGYPARLHTRADDAARLVVYAAAMAAGMLAGYERAQNYRGVDELTLRLHLVHTVLKERDAQRGRYRGNFDTFLEDRMREFNAEFERVVTYVPKVWDDELAFRATAQRAVTSALSMTFLEADSTEQWPWYTVPVPLSLSDLGRFGSCAVECFAQLEPVDLEPLMEGMGIGEGYAEDDAMDGTYQDVDEGGGDGEDMEAFEAGLAGVHDDQWTTIS
ncbi:uncharacterized protein LOC62_04G005370 [Vanrija pseudolonga]|uniref:Uncharacterized protein n=1 Tax=Vanrija pseudolonga TaxID=143232 RepID=A0AAF1BIQ9_9TREE|nr:hypothetical protein LOC62_04G005370 [Vanrija pseudolonga]